MLAAVLTDSPLKRRLASQLGKAREQWLAPDLPACYRHRVSVVKTPNLFLRRPEPIRDFFDNTGQVDTLPEDASCLSYLDLNTYLPDHILVKVDRAAMAFGLETRIPFLDHRVVEYMASIPEGLMARDGRPKWPLRQILARRLPQDLVERRKMGFCPPMGSWLRGPLRDWAEANLAADRLRQEGFFQAGEVRHWWRLHQQGKRNCAPLLWNLLVFQAWHASF
jgi:asparagine synthetase B (glutamine-hydrolysing)